MYHLLLFILFVIINLLPAFSLPLETTTIDPDGNSLPSTPSPPVPHGGNLLSISIISPSLDSTRILASQITVAVLIRTFLPVEVDVCLYVNGKWGGCKQIAERGGEEVFIDFELEDIPAGDYEVIADAAGSW